MRRGLLISIEGGDGVGKSTQVARLAARLREAGYDVLATREPGGTQVGDAVRALVKGGADPSPRAELLLFEAARAELVERQIKPAIERGSVVVTDRFADSSTAYQGFGRELGSERVELLNTFATGGLKPDLAVLLDLDADEAARRASGRDGGRGTDRRFESETAEFHRRVRDGYMELAAAEPERWFVVDASLAEDEVADLIWQRVAALLAK